jgi:hypothetical protein
MARKVGRFFELPSWQRAVIRLDAFGKYSYAAENTSGDASGNLIDLQINVGSARFDIQMDNGPDD